MLHTWDELEVSLMQYDVYSCACFTVEQILEEFEQFDPIKIEYKFLDRENSLIETHSNLVA